MRTIEDNDIIKRCHIPDRLPIDTDLPRYRAALIHSVRRDMMRGYSMEDAIIKATGRPPVSLRTRGAGRLRIVALATAFLVGGVGAALTEQTIQPQSVDALTPDNQISVAPMTDDETILVVGTDERPDKDQGSGTNIDVPGSRTDMMAMLTVPKDGSHAILVSFPRDLGVSRPKCDKFSPVDKKYDSDYEPAASNVKINSIYETGGPKCLTKTVEQLTGTKITKYVQTNFSAFQSLVDAVGGVDVDVKSPIVDDTLGTIVSEPGHVTLNGDTALSYVRARKVEGTGKSDFDRITRQQQFLSALSEKVHSKISSGDTSSLMGMARNVIPKLIVDNMDISDAMSLAMTVGKMPKSAVSSTTFPVKGEDEVGNLIPDTTKSEKLFTAIRSGTPIVGAPVSEDKKKDAIKAQVHKSISAPVIIVARSDTDEDALRIQQDIAALGVSSTVVTTKSTIPKSTTIDFPSNLADDGVTLASMFPKAQVSPQGKSKVRLVLGNDAGYMLADRTTDHGMVWVPWSGGEASGFIPLDITTL